MTILRLVILADGKVESSPSLFGRSETVISLTPTHIVTKRLGYSENPGSRYSGLMSYYPPEITVWEITDWLNPREIRVECVTSWDAGRKGNPIKPDFAYGAAQTESDHD